MAGPDLSAVAAVLNDYPQYAHLVTDLEVGPILLRAVDPATQFSPTRFQAEIMRTNWYRNRSAAAREWEILSASDPGEAWRRYNEAKWQVADIVNKAGYTVTGPEWEYITRYALGQGIEIGSPEFMAGLRNIIKSTGGRLVEGSIQGNMNSIANRARGDYFIHLPETDLYNAAVDQTLGFLDDQALQYKLQEYASSMYPHLRQQLDKGVTMRDLFSGHLQTLADEWEMDPNAIDVFAPTMQQIIGRRDPTTQQMRSASLYEAKVMARKDDLFYKTSKWHQLDANKTNVLLQAFGKRVA